MRELVNRIVKEIKWHAETHGMAERIVLHDVICNLINISAMSQVEPIIIKNKENK
jgi:hypothetical protein